MGIDPSSFGYELGLMSSLFMAQHADVLNRRVISETGIFFWAIPRCAIFIAIMIRLGWLCIVIAFSGCSTAILSPGATLLAGLAQYQGDMQQFGSSTARWPERQRAGGSLKAIVTATVGGSAEFYRLIDLDVRKREFIATMRQTSVRPERVKEMTEELGQMNDEIAALKPVIRAQLGALPFGSEPERRVEEVATRGLISMALDRFSANGGARTVESPSTKVGPFTVTDMGGFSTVRTADGQVFRCVLFGNSEDGAGISCEPFGK
jgi:hypothetical protein